MIASRLNRIRALQAVGLAAVWLAVPAVSVAQETDAQSAEPQAAEEQVSEAREAEAAKAAEAGATGQNGRLTSDRPGRFFLGARPQLQRQVGPVVGKPRSILPQPFVPVGSIQQPTILEQGAAPSLDPLGDAEAAEQLGPLEEDTLAVQTQPSGSADTTNDFDTALSENSLDIIDPSGVGVVAGEQAFPATLWADRPRADSLLALEHFSRISKLRPMQVVARKLALSPFSLDAPGSDAEVHAFVAARLAVLQSVGDMEGFLSLLSALPGDFDWSPLARQIANGHLIAGRIQDSCALAAVEREDSTDPYWLRLAAFCRAASADRVGVDFQLGILEEIASVSPTFYQLIDQILVEAEQGTQAVVTNSLVLASPLKVDVLEAAMARLAKVQVPILDTTDVSPFGAHLMLSLPGVAPAAKQQLIAQGADAGWLSSDILSAFLTTPQPLEMTPEELLGLAAVDDHLDTDIALIRFLTTLEDLDRRSEVVKIIADRALRLGRMPLIAPVIADMAVAQPEEADLAALILRGRLLSDTPEVAVAALTAMRASPAGSDILSDQLLTANWPLASVLLGDMGPAVTADRLQSWWQSRAQDEGRAEKAAVLFTALEGLGHTVPDTLWYQVEEQAVPVFEGVETSPALWRRMLIKAAEGDAGSVLVLAHQMTRAGAVSDAFLGSLLAVLRDLGFEREARQIATHVLIGRGL